MSASPYIAVCGKCNVPLELHPVEHCQHEYVPLMHDGRRIGFRMIDKKNKNGRKAYTEKPTA